MALKAIVDDINSVDENLRDQYEKRDDGKYALKIEGLPPGAVSRKELDEFRNTNIELKKQLDDIKSRYGDLDPDAARKALEQQQQQHDKKLIDEGKVEELLQQRTEKMRKEYENHTKQLSSKVDELNAERDKLGKQLSEILIDNQVSQVVSEVGVPKQGAMRDILARARNTFAVEDGKPIAKDGDSIVYGKDGKEPLTMQEWVSELVNDAPYLFESSSGSGGKGSDGSGGSGGTKVISIDDQDAINANVDKIASGEVEVR